MLVLVLYFGNCTSEMVNATDGVKFRICAPQQLQMQNGEHKSVFCSLEWSAWLSTISLASDLGSASISASAQGRQESTISTIDNRILLNFIAVNVVKVSKLFYGWGKI